MKKFLKRTIRISAVLVVLLGIWVFWHFYHYLDNDPTLKYHLQATTIPAMEERLFGSDEAPIEIVNSGDTISIDQLNILLEETIWDSLEADRQQRLSETVSFGKTRNTWRSCEVVYLQDTFPAKIRLRGDTPENYHFGLENASFRINLKSGSIKGMKKFSLLRPFHESGWYGYYYYHFMAEQGILANRFHFVNAGIAQHADGLWVMQEAFAPELHESQERENGFLLRFVNDCTEQDGYFNASGFPTLEPISAKQVEDNPDFFAKATQLAQLGSAPLSSSEFAALFDLQLWGRFAAINDVFYGHHAVDCHNVRLFYNAETQLLEPVAWDPGSYRFLPYSAPETFMSDYRARSPIYGRLFSDSSFLAAYTNELQKLTHSHRLEETIGQEQGAHQNLEDKMNQSMAVPHFDSENLYATRSFLQKEFHVDAPLNIEAWYYTAERQVRIKIYNPRALPWQIGGWKYDEEWNAAALTLGHQDTEWIIFSATPDHGKVRIRYKLPHDSDWKEAVVTLVNPPRT